MPDERPWDIPGWWRALNRTLLWPLNAIGDFLGYGHCKCGANWWWVPWDDDGWRFWGTPVDNAHWMICKVCYRKNKELIQQHNEQVEQE